MPVITACVGSLLQHVNFPGLDLCGSHKCCMLTKVVDGTDSTRLQTIQPSFEDHVMLTVDKPSKFRVCLQAM